ncbi:sigma-70 region 4 domain-containing protein [Paenibacillus wynnii]|uniref:Myb-like domain-containing protein n=2 Tax=Paenibacillus wynnii TaxID=268407 RepID=A0A098MF41_9BACL|nr:sigma-70 region 4 domain-containing protein [Paenibacillus wynnii]KGE20658.1 hypothetical protein PWYN_00175 [Paenibacillus wynnii]
MGCAKNWTKEEIDYLQDKWGSISLKSISQNLGRSIDAVKLKAGRMGLGDSRMNFDGITVNQLALALDKSYGQIVNYWVPDYGLPVRRKLFANTARVLVIGYEEFWKWAEQHKELLNLAKMEPNTLGAEPAWTKVKRKADQMRSQKTFQAVNWTPEEDQRLVQVLGTKGMTYPEVARLFDRSEASVKRRLHDLGVKVRPERLDNHTKYTPNEVQTLLRMAQEGYSYETIAQTLRKSALGVRGKLERMGFDFKRRCLKEKTISI